jgi:hypothetical protein
MNEDQIADTSTSHKIMPGFNPYSDRKLPYLRNGECFQQVDGESGAQANLAHD